MRRSEGLGTARVLALIGGSIISISSALNAPSFFPFLALHMGANRGMMGVWWPFITFLGLVAGLMVVMGGIIVYVRPEERLAWGILILIFSVLGVAGGALAIIGVVLGIVAGIITMVGS